ncbi:MAG: four helix bundle protein [Patescibacteria group bacterium]
MSKRDKLGLHSVIEKTCLNSLTLSIQASLQNQSNKQEAIRNLRIETEALKHLIRAEFELNIIKEKQYLFLQEKLQEISKEAVGWEKYVHKSSPQRELL